MVNYRRIVCEVVLSTVLVALAAGAPTPDCNHAAHTHYDQRQNGTENYRLNIDGVVIAVAPAESIMSAVGDLDDLLDLALEEYNTEYKPKPPASSSPSPLAALVSDEKPQDSKPEDVKPQEGKPEDKPVEEPKKPSLESLALSDVSMDDFKAQKKDASQRKHEKAQRLKNRLASFLLPLLRKTRHH